MHKIKVTLPPGEALTNGKQVSFVAPCACADTTCVQINGVDYPVVDAMGNVVTGVGGVWNVGAQVSVLIDMVNNKAFLQNAAQRPHKKSHMPGGDDPLTTADIGAVAKAGDTMTGSLKFKRGSWTGEPVTVTADGDVDGSALLLTAGGFTAVGSGEAPSNLYAALGKPAASEQLHLASDQTIALHTGCQTIGNRKTITIDTAGRIAVPVDPIAAMQLTTKHYTDGFVLSKRGYEVIAESKTWIMPSNVLDNKVTVIACGGGGGGGGVYHGGSAGGGGGGVTIVKDLTLTPGTSYACVIGAGGYRGSMSPTAGETGGTTTFGGTLVSAPGGTGGSPGTGFRGGHGGSGGSGGGGGSDGRGGNGNQGTFGGGGGGAGGLSDAAATIGGTGGTYGGGGGSTIGRNIEAGVTHAGGAGGTYGGAGGTVKKDTVSAVSGTPGQNGTHLNIGNMKYYPLTTDRTTSRGQSNSSRDGNCGGGGGGGFGSEGGSADSCGGGGGGGFCSNGGDGSGYGSASYSNSGGGGGGFFSDGKDAALNGTYQGGGGGGGGCFGEYGRGGNGAGKCSSSNQESGDTGESGVIILIWQVN